ncbi:MAG: D-alanyl-D-alanine carboxypeptidase/D-alanyl-D-alanine-endopeptidase [Acidobacteriota bacterium]|nr:D-alanyl-D-alanine carboxypeptidase/D-alanyl-D-alanine-endopeptidase [Blastocatellia bacterium]MDW8169308.1 D-alanyl-D-alanine carboxypeptidase/D-alanyl-D-alanine-endopeptidase [Acidobacteriota bacterium]MDW8257763.1 D-alanyl-D-alanine carboxypeptidase/D-alanyl-D-alanine-endopeptidase [Acidobacteriota bacterium]
MRRRREETTGSMGRGPMFTNKSRRSLIVAMALIGMSGHAAGGMAQPPLRTVRQLERRVEEIIRRPEFATTRWGILVESLDRRMVLLQREPDQLFTPASNMKLYTTAAALVRLGPDFRFRTSVYASARPDERGHVEGDVILYGRGDPNLSTRALTGGYLTPFFELADQLVRAGVREILGDIVGDESYFVGPRLGVGWEWDDLQWYYGAEVSALSVDDNFVDVVLRPGEREGDPVRVILSPPSPYMTVLNRAVTTAEGTPQQIELERGLQDNVLEIRGMMPRESAGYRAAVAVHHPALYAATLFREALERRGVRVRGRVVAADWKVRRERPLDLRQMVELAAVESLPLSEEIRVLNKISQNLHAEILLRVLGAEVKGEGSAEKGLEVIREFLREIGARTSGVRVRDGSGLSRLNLVTPAATVDLLRYMSQHEHGAIYRESLPIAGVDGTLERRMRGTPAEGNVRAKTGTLAYTFTLSGYVTTARGERLVFSFMANHHTGEAADVISALNELCATLAAFAGP